MSVEVKKTSEDWVPKSPPIPEHWVYQDFEEAFQALSTSKIKTPESKYKKTGRFPIVDQGKPLIGGYTDNEACVINKHGSVVVFGDHTRCFKLIKFPFAPGADGTKILAPNSFLEPRFAYYGCLSLSLPDRGYSRHYSFLKKSKFPIAPLGEQRRIVAKIEELFSELDKGVENLTTAREQLKAYRQSVLKHAFEGKLTEDWRAKNADKLESPETLLERIKQEREDRYTQALRDWEASVEEWKANGENGKKPAKPKKLRKFSSDISDVSIQGWTRMPLGMLIDDPVYGTSKKCDYNAGKKGVLRIPNISRGKIDSTDLKHANFDEHEIRQYQLIEGDILTIRSNGSLALVGKPAIIQAQDTDFVFAGYLIRLRAIPKVLLPRTLAYLMINHAIRLQIEDKAKSTSGVNNISAKELQDLVVPICSAEEQTTIVRILDEKLESVDFMEAEIDAALNRAEALRQSILKRAFSGQLVAQDPADEPASVLLERIRAEKEKETPKAKKRRTKKNAKKEAA